MKTDRVRIELKPGRVACYTYVGPAADGNAFYARMASNAPRLVRLVREFGTDVPLPKLPPISITPCRLLAPPVRETLRELKAIEEGTSLEAMLWQWEAISLMAHKTGLYLTPDDDGKLERLLAEFKKAAREDEQNREEYETLTLDDVKKGAGEYRYATVGRRCIRDKHLVGEWARENMIDLRKMDVHRADYLAWLMRECGSVQEQLQEQLLEPWGEDSQQFLSAAAMIRFRVEYEDAPAHYLTGIIVGRCDPSDMTKLNEIESSSGAGKQKGEHFSSTSIKGFISLYNREFDALGKAPLKQELLDEHGDQLRNFQIRNLADLKRMYNLIKKTRPDDLKVSPARKGRRLKTPSTIIR